MVVRKNLQKSNMSATVPSQYISSHQDYGHTFVSADTDSLWFLNEMDRLLALDDYNGFTLQPSPHADSNARRYLMYASYRMRLPEAEFTPDGEGGIDIEWENNGRRLALSCRSSSDSNDFISWREVSGQYDGREASQELLDERLRWLVS
jgi:hypothetical protein